MFSRGNLFQNWTYKNLSSAFKRLYKPGSKIGMIVDEEIIASCTRMLHKAEPPPMLSDRINVDARAMALPRDSHYFKIFNKKILQLVEAGLFDQYGKAWLERRDMKRNEEFAEPFKILTLDELEAGFVVCIVPLLISAAAFLYEWIVALKDLVVFWFIFHTFFGMRRSELERKSRARTKILQAKELMNDRL